MSPGCAPGEALFEQYSSEAERSRGFVHHYGKKDDEVQAKASGRRRGTESDPVCGRMNHQACSGGGAAVWTLSVDVTMTVGQRSPRRSSAKIIQENMVSWPVGFVKAMKLGTWSIRYIKTKPLRRATPVQACGDPLKWRSS